MVYKKRHALSRLLSKQRIQEKTSTGNWTSRYIGSLIYKGVNGQESLEGIQTADGVIDCSSGVSSAQMQYFLRDHLGSVRVVASDKNTVVSRTDYLPFGVRMTGNGLTESSTARSAWFGFSGKENELWNAERDETKRIIRFIRIRVVLWRGISERWDSIRFGVPEKRDKG